MSFKHQALMNQVDRSQRSVFVGNISYEVAEETIKQIFAKVGQVLSMKMVHDRETGKPKGYGFIEFPDVQTAELAIRNLNGYELNGRQLRVDSAAGGERSAEEIVHLQAALGAQQVEESPYGPECESGKAPEMIARIVSSMPRERMFEMMKEMKQCAQSNVAETKQLLMHNPQLAYALLQLQVVMRVLEPQTALSMLHREPAVPAMPFHHPNFNMPPPTSFAPPAQQGSFGRPQQQDISAEDQQNAQLLMQVMQLSDAEIAMLPAGDREKVIELRNKLLQAQ